MNFQAIVSYRRIVNFLDLDEIKEGTVESDVSAPGNERFIVIFGPNITYLISFIIILE